MTARETTSKQVRERGLDAVTAPWQMVAPGTHRTSLGRGKKGGGLMKQRGSQARELNGVYLEIIQKLLGKGIQHFLSETGLDGY